MKLHENQVAVITGAASGIGEAIARQCAEKKMKLVLADINGDKLVEIEKELSNLQGNVISVVTNVSSKKDISHLANVAISTFGKIHLLFNNAGIAGPLGALWEIEESALQKIIDVNLMSVIYCLREFIPKMLAQNEECYVINTASGAGLVPGPNLSGYSMVKHAVVALSEILYFDLNQRGANIHVSVVCPGIVNTKLAESLMVEDEALPEVNELSEFFKMSIKKGMSPYLVADQIFDAIEKNQFYILTHYDEHKKLIQNRMENILERRNPEYLFRVR